MRALARRASVASRIDLRYVCVWRAGKRSLKSPGGCGKVGGKSCSLQVGIAPTVDLNHGEGVKITSAEVRGVNESISGGVQLRYEGITATSIGRLNGIHCREVGREGFARDVRVASSVHCNRFALFIAAAT